MTIDSKTGALDAPNANRLALNDQLSGVSRTVPGCGATQKLFTDSSYTPVVYNYTDRTNVAWTFEYYTSSNTNFSQTMPYMAIYIHYRVSPYTPLSYGAPPASNLGFWSNAVGTTAVDFSDFQWVKDDTYRLIIRYPLPGNHTILPILNWALYNTATTTDFAQHPFRINRMPIYYGW
jgi:hypothetical protein